MVVSSDPFVKQYITQSENFSSRLCLLPLYWGFFAVNCKLRRYKLEIWSQSVKISESPYLQLERNCSKIGSEEEMFYQYAWTCHWLDFTGLFSLLMKNFFFNLKFLTDVLCSQNVKKNKTNTNTHFQVSYLPPVGNYHINHSI